MKQEINPIDINHTTEFIRGCLVPGGEVSSYAWGIIYGSGLGLIDESLEIHLNLNYSQIPCFPESTSEAHAGELILGKWGTQNVCIMNGRHHFYEGYSPQEIGFPIRVMKQLGVKNLIVTSIVGGLYHDPGNLLILKDHINLMGINPLVGKHYSEFGERYVDMSEPYDPDLRNIAKLAIRRLGLVTYKDEVTLASVIGPNLETKAEYRLLKQIGVDVVGMSVVPEVLVARQCGMNVLALCLVSDKCDPDDLKPVKIEDLIKIAKEGSVKLNKIINLVLNEEF